MPNKIQTVKKTLTTLPWRFIYYQGKTQNTTLHTLWVQHTLCAQFKIFYLKQLESLQHTYSISHMKEKCATAEVDSKSL